MKTQSLRALALASLVIGGSLHAQVPQLLNYQGRVAVGTPNPVNFDGPGFFKFALVNSNGSTTYWSNDGSSVAGSQPTAAVPLTVTKGLYSVQLGDTSPPLNMTAIPATVFTNPDVRLRVWFNDGINGSQLLTPDQRITSVGYAMMATNATTAQTATTATTVADGAITSAKIAAGAITNTQLADGAVTSAKVAAGAITSAQIATGAITATHIAAGAITGETWLATATTGAPAARQSHTALWSGTEMLIWGGFNNSGFLGDGARFSPSTGAWSSITSSSAPSARDSHVVVWTGTQMLVWGGIDDSAQHFTRTGGSYNPSTNAWTSISTTAAPSGRQNARAVWTGTEMLVWGGGDAAGNLNTGGRYNPSTDTWSAIATTGAPTPRTAFTSVWTGTEMVIWGGTDGSGDLATGARYNPNTNTWTPITTTGAPFARDAHSAVWTGSEMIVFGGIGTGTTGGRYNPTTDSWLATSTTGAPLGSYLNSVIWNGTAMIVWGGYVDGSLVNSGASYSPTSNTWTPLVLTNVPTARLNHSAIWSGSEMIVWGGGYDYLSFVNTGGRYFSPLVPGAVGSNQLAPNLTLGGTTTGTFAGSGTTAFQTVLGTSQTATANTNYLLTNAALSTVTLPAGPNVGDVVRINGVGAGGWQAAPNSGQTIVGAGSSGPFGVTWTPRDSVRAWQSVASSADGTKLVATVDNGQIYTSTDSGANWTARDSSRAWRRVASSSDGTRLVAVVNNGQIYTSVDSGVSWIARESVRPWLDVTSSADGTKLAATSSLGGAGIAPLYTSTDSGVTWIARESRYWRHVASSGDGTKLFACTGFGPTGQDHHLFTSTDSGISWVARYDAGDYDIASSADGATLLANLLGGSGYQIIASSDSGVSWVPQPVVGPPNGGAAAISADGVTRVVSRQGLPYISTDSGVTWTQRGSNRNYVGFALSANGNNLVAVANNERIYISTGSIIGNPLTGTAGTTAALQYLGNNQWQTLTEANAASANSVAASNITGTLTSSQLAPDLTLSGITTGTFSGSLSGNATTATSAANITGIVTGSQIASGAIGSTQLAPNLTLNGTTTGTFSGSLSGNAATATSATTFTGTLSGDVTGTRGATVVGTVGGISASSVATGANASNTATSAYTTNTIVKRDASGNFSAGIISGTFVGNGSGLTGVPAGIVSGVLALPATSSSSVGVITQNGGSLIHTYGSQNFFAGLGAGNFTMTDSGNTGIGPDVLALNTTGRQNTATGFRALWKNTDGLNNTAEGYRALSFNTTGSSNTAIGHQSLAANSTASANTAVGTGSLNANIGDSNTAIGESSLNKNTTGYGNTAVGKNALYNNIVGTGNTAVGVQALNNTTGVNNIGIGILGGQNLTTGIYNIDIGNQGVAGESSTVRIGTAGNQNRVFVSGIRGVTTGVSDAVAVVIDSNGQFGTVSSSRRYKEDIADMGDASKRLMSLRPVTFRYKKPYDNGDKPVQYGLIAEEVAETFPDLAVYNDEGQPETVKYQDLAPMLLNELQKLKMEKDELVKQLAVRNALDKERDARIARLESLLPPASAKTTEITKGN